MCSSDLLGLQAREGRFERVDLLLHGEHIGLRQRFDSAQLLNGRFGAVRHFTQHLSAVQEVEKQYGLPVVAIANLNDLFTLLQNNAEFGGFLELVRAYRERYGVA